MKIFTQRISHDQINTNIDISTLPSLALPFDTRQKCRFKATLNTNEPTESIGVDLPRDSILRNGSIIATNAEDYLIITAAAQPIMQVLAHSPFELMRAAYHLGNRHVPLMLTEHALYFEPDHVLQTMLEGLGVTVTETEHPFEPESGAYHSHPPSHAHTHSSHSH